MIEPAPVTGYNATSLGWFALALQLYLLLVLARSVGLMLNDCENVEFSRRA